MGNPRQAPCSPIYDVNLLMPFCISCSMTTSCMHILTERQLNSSIRSCKPCFHIFCFIQQIILKSKFDGFLMLSILIVLFNRVLISCIKFLSDCMCPRCLSLKKDISQVASKRDMKNRVRLERVDSAARRFDIELVRRLLFEKGINITSVYIARILEGTSGVPTRVCIRVYFARIVLIFYSFSQKNAFSEFSNRLYRFKFNFYQLLVPDLLHEFELGIWKAIFVHLIRILYAYGNDSISKLNSRFVSILYWYIKFSFVLRFRRIAPFGRDTIRKFSNNASAMKKLAAQDYEDLLQVRNHVCRESCCSHFIQVLNSSL